MAGIAHVITPDRATGAQVIDGSLKFDGSYLKRTPGSAGNRKTFTWSGWVKLNELASFYLFNVPDSSGHASFMFDSGQLRWNTYSTSTNGLFTSNAYFRDTGWYHVVFAFDATQSTTTDRIKVYVNGERLTSSSYTAPDGSDTPVNNTVEHNLGANKGAVSGDVNITNNYLIDGQALQPSEFGFTDPLTNTWKPKKYTGTFGTNGFYLPFDGNSPIGQDQSGQGNNYTPVNFGGSVALDNPQVSGARPILNTTQGGSQATVGVFGSRQNVGYAVTVYDDGGGNKYYIDGVKQATLTGLIRGATYTFDTSDSTVSSHPFRFSTTTQEGGGSATLYSNGVAAITGAATTITVPYNAPNTLYYYCTSHSGMGADITGITTNEKLADQYASHCTLALPLVSDDDDVCASIACTANNKTPTNSSVTAATTHSNFYSGSHYWSANSDTLQYAEQGNELVFGSGDYTIECWLYDDNGHNGTNNRCYIFDNRIGGSVVGDPPTMTGYIDSHNEFNFGDGTNTITHTVPSTVGKWWHYAVTREGTTTRMFIDGILRGSATSSTNFTNNGIGVGRATDANYGFAGYIQDFRVYTGIAKYTSNFVVPSPSPDILPDTPSGVSGGSKLTISPDTSTEGAVVFDGDSDYLSSTGPGTLAASSNWCMECTFYCTGDASGTYRIMGANESSESSEYLQMRIRLGQYQFYTENANTLTGTAAFKKWTHMALTKSGTTVRAFVDGKQLWSTTDNNADDITTLITGWGYGSEYFPGFISNARFVNGSSVYTSEFNPPVVPLTNITNTTHLFCQSNTSATAAAVGTITANGTAAASRFTPFNTDINTVRGQETGYPTFNPLDKVSTNTLSNGNLTSTASATSAVRATKPFPKTGKWYVEYSMDAVTTNGYPVTGISKPSINLGAYSTSGVVAVRPVGSGKNLGWVIDGTDTPSDYMWTGFASSDGDTMQIAYNADEGAFYMGVNNFWWGLSGSNAIRVSTTDMISGTNSAKDVSNEEYFAWSMPYTNAEVSINFGQKPFKFPPPDGFQPLNTANTRPVKVISRPDQYVGISTWTGDGNTGRNIKTLQFKPDLVWIKQRSATRAHALFDSVRGANKRLQSSSNNAETTHTDQMSAFIDNGFTVEDNNTVNVDSGTYVAWCWKAGGSKGTFNIDDVSYASAAAAGLDGGLTVTGASVGTKQGFSIIKATGSDSQNSFKHGLGKVPKFVIAKDMDNSRAWYIYHGSLGANYRGSFDGAQFTSDSEYFGSGMTDTLVTLKSGGSGGNNYNGANMIYYVWADVPGLQKFGTYSGNSNADGPFIELGFRPALFVMKQTDSTGYWMVYDSARDPINNGSPYYLFWNDNSAHGTGYDLDFLSNGVKLRTDNANFNTTSYVYMAWAEAPTIDLFGGGANAR